MAVYTVVTAEALSELLSRYDVGQLVAAKGIAEGVENTNYMVDTTEGRFILTLYEKRVDEADLPFFLSLLDHLADRTMPVPRAVRASDGSQIQNVAGRPACLIEFLPGFSLSHPEAIHAENAGRALAALHDAVADFAPTRPNTMGVESWPNLFERCGQSLDSIAPGLYDDLAFAIEDVVCDWNPSHFDQCAIHADLFPDNVLMQGDAVTGLIDFYFACTDIRIYDLAVMHSAWSFDASGQHYDAAVGDSLLRGYQSRFPFSGVETAGFQMLACGACIRFTLSRAWDWLNTPADALVTRKDPLTYMRRLKHYDPALVQRVA